MRTYPDNPVAEQAIADRFAASLGAKELKFDRYSKVDRVLYRDAVIGFIEIKTSNYVFGSIPVFRISRTKILDLRILNSILLVPVALVVRFACGTIGHLNVWTDHVIEENWGRDDRGDAADREQAAVFQWWQFKRLP